MPDKKAGIKVVGVPGNTDYDGWGSLDSGEYLSRLKGQAGARTYDQMRRSDPQVGAVLKALTLPIRKANYYIEPASEDPKDIEIAEIIQKNLFEEMSITWDDTIRHALLMLTFGFFILEKVWHVKDNLFQVKKLDPRLPTSVIRWEYDKSKKKLIGPVQQDTDGKEYQLPIEKILVFTVDREGDNWEGMSVLRQAYKPWVIKDKLEKINAIKHDRHGVGIPVIKVPASVKEGTDEWRRAEAMGEGIYAHEKMYVIEPDGYEVRLMTPDGGQGGTDALPSIQYNDEEIAKAVLAMFLNLGTSQTGSRALGGSFIDIFLDSLQTYANYICEVITRFLIREYVDYNWNVTEYPKLKVGKIKNLDTHTISELVKAGVLTPDEGMEISVREELNLPEKKEVPSEEEEEIEAPAPLENEEGMEEDVEEQEEIVLKELLKKLPKELKEKVTAAIKKEYKFQEANLTMEEQIPNLEQIELRLNDASLSTRAAVLSIRDFQAKDIIQQIVAGRKPNKIRVIQKKEQYDTLMKAYKS